MRTLSASVTVSISACITIMILSTSNILNGQEVNNELIDDREYAEVVKRARVITVESKAVQQVADKKTNEIITQTASTITTLKEEVQQLKEDLNEANQKLDDANSITNTRRFPIRAIPGSEEDW